MRKTISILLLFITIPFSYTISKSVDATSGEVKLAIIHTNQGKIKIKLYETEAPETSKNFIEYAKSGKYNGTIFHRVIANFMIQGGGHLPDMSEITTNAPIINESSNNISNKKGTIAMARTSDPHSATSQFFINLKDNDFLDKSKSPDGYGYCVFGEVVEGIEIVEKIGTTKTGNVGYFSDVPTNTITIDKIEIAK
tara:strand:- start:278 stop:865 length:588 start_codon:yes stop_codon:yes gene_type:complete